MYIIDKLQKLKDYSDNGCIESVLSCYLLEHLKDIEYISLQRCMKETGVSKSSVHRFFSSGGFDSFKELIEALYKEIAEEFDNNQSSIHSHFYLDNIFNIEEIILLSKMIQKSNKVFFYGSQKEIDKLQYLIRYLRIEGKQFSCLNIWNINKAYERLQELQQHDLLLLVDTSLKIQNLYELSVNNKDILSIDDIMGHRYNKVFIGNSDGRNFGKITTVRLDRSDVIGLEKMDLCLYNQLKRGKK